jgi:hypothetical protein
MFCILSSLIFEFRKTAHPFQFFHEMTTYVLQYICVRPLNLWYTMYNLASIFSFHFAVKIFWT